MSGSPERISSYRRHFEDNCCSSYQVRVSSPSPNRRDGRHGSTGYPCRPVASSVRVESVGRRTTSAARRSHMVGTGVNSGALVCVGPNGELPMDLDVTAADNQDFLNTRTSERQEMVVLNDRLAVYIDKVRSLEQQNTLLEAEIEAYQNRFEKPTGLRLLYEEQLRELRKISDQMRVQRDISLAAKESTAAQLEAIKVKYEVAVELRKKAEADIEAFRPDVDQATSSRIALEKKLEQLEVEIEFLKRVHQQEIDELMRRIYAAQVSASSAFAMPDIAAALKQIQTQYDEIAAKNLQEMDSWYQNKFDDISKKSTKHVDKARSFREEIAGARKDIQNNERDLDSLRTKNEALEAEILEKQGKYKKEIEDLQARIESLQLEMKSIKEKIALHLREYQDLLNVKMALEIEITTYRKLIEGEDLRLSGLSTLQFTSCSMSAIGAGMSVSGGGVGVVGGMGGGVIGNSDGMDVRWSGEGGGSHSRGTRAAPNRETIEIGSAENRRRVVGSGNGAATRGDHGVDAEDSRRVSSSMPAGGSEFGPSGEGSKFAGARVSAGTLATAELGVSEGGAGGSTLGNDGGSTRDMGVGRFSPGGKLDGSSLGVVGDGVIGLAGSGARVGANGLGAGAKTNMGGVDSRGESDRVVGTIGAKPGGLGKDGGLGVHSGSGVAGGAGDPGFGGSAQGALHSVTRPGGVGLAGASGSRKDNGGLGADVGTGSQVSGVGANVRSSEAGAKTAGASSAGNVGGFSDTRGDDFAKGTSGLSHQGETGGSRGGNGVKVGGLGSDGKGCGSGFRDGVAVENVGVANTGRGTGDVGGAIKGYGFDGSYGQAVELTERRTVLIRTIKRADDVLEMDHQEQTYIISGAADESDNE